MTTWVSEREASRMLLPTVGYRNAAVRLLKAGLAGTPTMTSTALLYDRERVAALSDWAPVDEHPHPTELSLLEVRIPSRTEDWRDLGNASAVVRLHVVSLVERHGFLPTVVISTGFVLAGADTVAAVRPEPDVLRLETRAPGEWFGAFEGRRLPTSRGNPWRLWTRPAGPTSGQRPPK